MFQLANRALTHAEAVEPPDIRWHFSDFSVLETHRRLERAGETVPLGPRSFDLLLQLLRQAGEFVSKDALLSTVWNGVVVDDGSVRVHMSMLRKVLGRPRDSDGCSEWITNVPLRGYRFNGRARREGLSSPTQVQLASLSASFSRLPVRLSALIGRDQDIDGIRAALKAQRLITLVGTGGIGKTSVAVHVGERCQLSEGVQIAFVDLSPLVSRDHVLGTIARSVGAPADTSEALAATVQRLAGRDVLLLVDNCEHVLDSVAQAVMSLLSALPRLRVLATSREPLNVPGERIIRLSPLATPNEGCHSLESAMRWASIRLLVERAKAAGATTFTESQVPQLVSISRQVDGIPLAIELVAARLGVQSIDDLHRRLNSHMRVYALESRSASPRHRTLAAALEWSVALLGNDERRVLRRLSVFRGRFDVSSALGVTTGEMEPEVTFDALISLVNKSLICFDGSDSIAPYRLLDTTRSYAAEMLAKSNEVQSVRHAHAQSMINVMQRATEELQELSEQAWSERYAYRLDDVRFALDSCLIEPADAVTAASLSISSAPLWFRLSEVGEYLKRVRTTLDCVQRSPKPDRLCASQLEIARYNALWHTGGTLEDMAKACERALAGALEFQAQTLEFQARWGLCALNITRGDYTQALRHAEVLHDHANLAKKPVAQNLSLRMLSLTSHFCGAFAEAQKHALAASTVDEVTRRHRDNAFQPDARTTALAILSRTLWIRGDSQLAMTTAVQCEEEAQALGHELSLCVALFWICPIAIWSGEWEAARRWVATMLYMTDSKGFDYWHRWALCYDDALRLNQTQKHSAHIEHIRHVRERIPSMDNPRREMLATFCGDWSDEELIVRALNGEGQWCAAEVFRAAGTQREQKGDVTEAKAFYLRALETARSQGAVAWELRAAQSLQALARVSKLRPR